MRKHLNYWMPHPLTNHSHHKHHNPSYPYPLLKNLAYEYFGSDTDSDSDDEMDQYDLWPKIDPLPSHQFRNIVDSASQQANPINYDLLNID